MSLLGGGVEPRTGEPRRAACQRVALASRATSAWGGRVVVRPCALAEHINPPVSSTWLDEELGTMAIMVHAGAVESAGRGIDSVIDTVTSWF